MKRKVIKYGRIKEERLKCKMTQEELARAIGVSTNTYAIRERGKRNFRLHQMMKLALFFGTTMDYLLELEDK